MYKKRVLSIALIIIMCLSSFSFAKQYNVKLTDLTYVRKNVNGEIIGSLGKNTVKTVYKVIKDDNGTKWYKIWYKGKASYISSASTTTNLKKTSNFNVLTTDLTTIRDDVWGNKVGFLHKNIIKTVYGFRVDRQGRFWYRIWYNGKSSYILSSSTRKDLRPLTDFNVNLTELTNVRKTVWGEKIGSIRKNTLKTVYGFKKDLQGRIWYRIWYKGKAAYIYSASTSKSSKVIDDFDIVTKTRINVRQSVWGEKIGHLNKNTVKTVYGTRRDRQGKEWYRIWYKGGPAYISSYYVRKNVKLIAITFDDGPSKYTRRLLDELKKEDARATFFLLGSKVNSSSKSVILKMQRDGHEIANHSYSHKYMPKLSGSAIKYEFNQTDWRIKAITGRTPRLVRYPYGGSNNRVRAIVKKPEIFWSLDTIDWKTRSRYKVKKMIIDNAKAGDIVLLHDTHKTSVEGALDAIKILKKRGYKFVTVSELMDSYNIKMRSNKRYYRAK